MDAQTIITFFETVLGEIPPEFEGFIYILGLLVVLFIIDGFFTVFSALFRVSQWK